MKHLLWCGLCLFCNVLLAQVVTVSEEVTLRNEENYHIIGRMKGQTLVLEDKETEFQVQAFDQDLKKTWDKEIVLDKRRPKILGVVSDENAFHIVYQKTWRLETLIKIHTYDAAANLIDSLAIKNYGSSISARDYAFLGSEDRSKFLLYHTENNRNIHALVFDLDTKEVLWEESFAPDNLLLTRDQTQIVLGDDGGVHIIVEKDNFKYKLEKHHYEVYYYSPQDTLLKTYEIDMRSHLSYDVYFDYDSQNKRLLAGGLYGVKNQAWAEGAFFLSIDSNQPDAQTMAFHPFEDELVEQFLGKEAPNKNRGINDAVIQEIMFRQDGGLIGVIERKKVNERPYTRTSSFYDGQVIQLRDYYYEDLMIFSIHPDGRLHWTNVLYKKQFSQDQDVIFASYFPMKTPKQVRFIFNDDIKYENTVSEYVVRGNGKYDRNSVMSTDNQKLRLRFQDAVQISSKAILVPSEYRNRLRLVRIVFE